MRSGTPARRGWSARVPLLLQSDAGLAAVTGSGSAWSWSPVAVAHLRLGAQARERLRAGPRWQEQGLVFPNTVGRPMLPQNLLQRSLYPLLQRAGLPRLRFYDLRHSAATLLLPGGCTRRW